MNDDDIPVLNVLREKLIAGIAEHGARRHRLPTGAAAAAAACIAIVAAVLLATQPNDSGRQVIVHGPSVGQPGGSETTAVAGVASSDSTSTVAASSGNRASVTTTTTRPSVSPTSIAPPTPTTTQPAAGTTPSPPTTITLTVADRNSSFAVTMGTIIDVHLDGDSTAIWPAEPTSTDSGVLHRISGASSPTSSQTQFVAVAPGTAQLSAVGGRPCPAPAPTGPPQGCVAIGISWGAKVEVK